MILQFSGHYFAYLNWAESGNINGDPVKLLKFYLLFRNALVWYGVVAIAMAELLILAGFYFFNQQQIHSISITWQMPWIFLVIFTA